MRHISRITKLIYEKEQINIVDGIINGHPMKILFDIRGEFNVITKTALKLIEMSDGSLQRLYKSKSIPSYLKKEKKVKFKAVRLKIEAYFQTIKEEAMILPENTSCVLIGRQACKKLDYANKRRVQKDKYVLTRWGKERSEKIMQKMRSNLQQNLTDKVQSSSKPEGTQEGSGSPAQQESTEKSTDENEDCIIVREVQQSAAVKCEKR